MAESHGSERRRTLVAEETERLQPVRRELDLVAFQAERTPERLAQRGVVVDYKNSHLHAHHPARR